MSVGPTRGPVQRPSDDRDFTEIFQRLTDLERFANATPPRIVYGAVDDDGNTVDAGSGDWSAVFDGIHVYTFTVTPAFSAAIWNVVATIINLGSSDDPGLVTTDNSPPNASTFVVTTWNFIGDPWDYGFAFAAFEDPA